MIGRIQGLLLQKNPPRILVDCHGVGYEIDVPMSTLYQLPDNGQQVTLLTHFVVREDAQLLFGFATESEREAFKTLIKISGVGARTALAILSGMSVSEIGQAVAMQESARLTTVPGIGKKTAERLLLELKGKFGVDTISSAPNQIGISSNSSSEILQALLALGYSDKEAVLALKNIPTDVSVSDGIRMALKTLSKG
ncbi:Holliday junction branch migration protein RuvA [Polynucleobacter rarus]|uniref:Holliday junction branch migration protein RuvA n=1 Tax=Polynucleobacter rarus TaxID=556055 RepID=UPI000D3E521D|nr:Holliday junction branch migration protein RuvA [Polynucleobacter rarus]